MFLHLAFGIEQRLTVNLQQSILVNWAIWKWCFVWLWQQVKSLHAVLNQWLFWLQIYKYKLFNLGARFCVCVCFQLHALAAFHYTSRGMMWLMIKGIRFRFGLRFRDQGSQVHPQLLAHSQGWWLQVLNEWNRWCRAWEGPACTSVLVSPSYLSPLSYL